MNDDKTMKPNILYIMSDDHAATAIGTYGSRLTCLNPTPNIDALANRGMRFDQVFCVNSICTPSRANIITGQYCQTNGVLDLTDSLDTERQYLPQAMKKAGYETAMIGKWHLKNEPVAFDHYCVLPGQGQYFDPEFLIRGDKPWPGNVIQEMGKHSTDAITDFSLEWLKNGRDMSKPFFLMHHFKAPHDMFENAPRYEGHLEEVEIPEPDNLHNQPQDGFGSIASRPYGAGLTKNHPSWNMARKLGVDPDLPEPAHGKLAYQRYLKRYLRCVKGIDDNIQRLVDYLEVTGELGNTIIIYTSDQGFLLGEHDLIDKRWMYEESLKMPFIICGPGIAESGSSNDWLINNTDFAPTILELVGVEKTPEYMQGCSFGSALKGEDKPVDWRDATYYRYWMHMAHGLQVPAHFGVRDDRYKLMFFYGCKPDGSNQTPAAWELYDCEADPFENRNCYEDPGYKDVIERMKKQILQLREELGETDDACPAVQSIIEAHWND